MFGLGVFELLIVGLIAVLLFGERLPEVAKSMGNSYNQFRKGLSEIQREMDRATHDVKSSVRSTTKALTYNPNDYEEPTGPKFELPQAPSATEKPTMSDETKTTESTAD